MRLIALITMSVTSVTGIWVTLAHVITLPEFKSYSSWPPCMLFTGLR
jgi:hypothetical protein